jgi:hypothetical protein
MRRELLRAIAWYNEFRPHTSLGGRDSDARSLAIGDTMVLTNNLVNNVRFTYHHTNVHRTNAPYFGPSDVGIKAYTYVPDVTLVSVTNAFNLGLGTEFDSFYRPNTYAFSDDLTMVHGSHQFGFGGVVSLNDWKTRSNVRTSAGFTATTTTSASSQTSVASSERSSNHGGAPLFR